jgi:pilus assembly protein Flp/PilA
MGRTTYVERTLGARYLSLTGTSHPGIPGASTQGATPIMLHFEMIKTWLTARIKSDRGASLVEYALLVALIAVVCVMAVQTLGERSKSSFERTGSELAGT